MNIPSNNMIRVHFSGGIISAMILGSHKDDKNMRCRYWLHDPTTGRTKPVEATASYCPEHALFYLDRDFPTGCPNCHPSKTPRHPC